MLMTAQFFDSGDREVKSVASFSISSGILLGCERVSDFSVLHVLMVEVFLRTCGLCSVSSC